MSLGGLWYLANRGGAELPLMTPAVAQTPAVEPVQETSAPAAADLKSTSPLWDATATRNIGMGALFAQLEAGAESQKGDASIAGVVVDKQGNPMSGMNVISGGDLFDRPLPSIKTDGEGKFSATELIPGEYKIMAVPAVSGGAGIDSGYQKVTLKQGQSLGDIRLVYEGATNRTVSGMVTDSEGNPIAGVRLNSNDMATSSMMFSTHTETGADGRFVLEAREGKRIDVSLSHPLYTEAHFYGWEAGTNDLEIVL
jgi:hypothetical protein